MCSMQSSLIFCLNLNLFFSCFLVLHCSSPSVKSSHEGKVILINAAFLKALSQRLSLQEMKCQDFATSFHFLFYLLFKQ